MFYIKGFLSYCQDFFGLFWGFWVFLRFFGHFLFLCLVSYIWFLDCFSFSAILASMEVKQMLDINIEKGIAVLAINNPPVNALSSELIAKLKFTLRELNQKTDVKVLIITGSGKTFCAGADIKELSQIKTSREGERFARNGHELMDMVELSDMPVIAAINGACIGGGNELAIACHIRIASENAWFSQPEISLGIIPGFGGTQRLPKLVGKGRAVELILTGEKITNKGRIAIRSCVKAINGAEAEAVLFGRVCETGDKEEGIKAFLEKRQAGFKG